QSARVLISAGGDPSGRPACLPQVGGAKGLRLGPGTVKDQWRDGVEILAEEPGLPPFVRFIVEPAKKLLVASASRRDHEALDALSANRHQHVRETVFARTDDGHSVHPSPGQPPG